MVEEILQLLEMYKGEENRDVLQTAARQISFIKTWGGLKGFINLLENQCVHDFMMYPIRFIENTGADALLPEGKPNWKVINGFKKDFTKENGPFRWPISDETELTRQHLGAIRALCLLPGYGRNLWDGYATLALLTGQKDGAHSIGMMYYKALYFSLPELPKREKKK